MNGEERVPTGRGLRTRTTVTITAIVLAALGGTLLRLAPGSADPAAGAPRIEVEPGKPEVTLVFIGSASCRFSRSAQVGADWRVAVEAARQQAADAGFGFQTLGIAVSNSPSAGLALLKSLGGMDEMNVGGGWMSLGVGRYLVRTFPGPDATPQVLVLSRRRTTEGWGLKEETLVRRVVGAADIGRWVDGGTPLLCGRLTDDESQDESTSGSGVHPNRVGCSTRGDSADGGAWLDPAIEGGGSHHTSDPAIP